MIELSVCIGTSCHLKGAYNVLQTFLALIEECDLHDKIELKSTFCLKQCAYAGIGVVLGQEHYRVMPGEAANFFRNTVLPLARAN